MKLKKFILFTVILSSLFVAIGLYLGNPIAFIPENATSFESLSFNGGMGKRPCSYRLQVKYASCFYWFRGE